MRLREIYLIETTEEDRAIVSLASALSNLLTTKYDNHIGPVGTIGELVDTPLTICNSITIELDNEQGIQQRMKDSFPDDVTKLGTDVEGIWYADDKTIVIDEEYLGSSYLQSVLAHELRHALDDFKSDFKANVSSSYSTPKKKEFRNVTNDPYVGNMAYIAEPAEINARFLQVLDQLTTTIRQSVKLYPNDPKPAIMKEFKNILAHYHISDLFPEKELSKDYKRLMKRAIDYIEKELAHLQNK